MSWRNIGYIFEKAGVCRPKQKRQKKGTYLQVKALYEKTIPMALDFGSISDMVKLKEVRIRLLDKPILTCFSYT